MQTLRFDELRAWVRVWSGSAAPAWSGRQQVHLVRLDGQRLGLPLLADTTP